MTDGRVDSEGHNHDGVVPKVLAPRGSELWQSAQYTERV